MNDNEKRELVNRLTLLAIKFAHTNQLRERIAEEVVPALEAVCNRERERAAAIAESLSRTTAGHAIAAAIRD